MGKNNLIDIPEDAESFKRKNLLSEKEISELREYLNFMRRQDSATTATDKDLIELQEYEQHTTTTKIVKKKAIPPKLPGQKITLEMDPSGQYFIIRSYTKTRKYQRPDVDTDTQSTIDEQNPTTSSTSDNSD